MNNKLIKYIKKIIQEELTEMSTTGGLPGYNSAYAFSKDNTKSIDQAKSDGYTVVDKDSPRQDKATVDNGYKVLKQKPITSTLTESQRLKILKKLLIELSRTRGVPGDPPGFDFSTNTDRMNKYIELLGWEVIDLDKMKRITKPTLQKQGFGIAIKSMPNKIVDNDIANKIELTQTEAEPLAEAKYSEYKNDSSLSQKQKLNIAIKNMNTKLRELEHILNQNIKLKTEYKLNSEESYWKSTKSNLEKIQQRLTTLSNKLKHLS